MTSIDGREDYICQITIGGRTYSLRDCGARDLIAARVSPEQLQSAITKYHEEHPESDPTVGSIPLDDVTAIFD